MTYSKHALFLLSFPLLLRLSSAQSAVKAAYWFPDSGVSASDIDSSLYTVLFCAFAALNPSTFEAYVPPKDAQSFATFTPTVRLRNPAVKTLLSVGGGDDAATKAAFPVMAADWNRRQAFVRSSIKLARDFGFDGIDLDWEQPETAEQMTQLGFLVDEWRIVAAEEAPALLLTAAVYYSAERNSVKYVVAALARSLDWINVMAYDFYGPSWSNLTGPPAALYNPGSQVSGDSGIKAWISEGFPANKIVLGFPFFGHAWTLLNPTENGYSARAVGPALGNTVTYKQIKRFIADNYAATVHSSEVVGDYCYSGVTWIGYDDYPSIIVKVRYAKRMGLRGYFAWHVGADDNMELARAASWTW